MKNNVQTFNVSFPKALATQIDAMAKKQFGSRSDFLRTAAMRYLQEQREFEELLKYGKQIGNQAGYRSEEAVVEDITEQRRAKEPWRNVQK